MVHQRVNAPGPLPTTALGWRNQTPLVRFQITWLSAEARTVTESETEAERLRAQARRALELARAINDPEAALRLKAHAAELLERAAAIERKGRAEFDNSHYGTRIDGLAG